MYVNYYFYQDRMTGLLEKAFSTAPVRGTTSDPVGAVLYFNREWGFMDYAISL